MDKKIGRDKNCIKEVEAMAVSVKPTPIFVGESAKRLMEYSKDNTELFRKCKDLAKIFIKK